MKCLNCNYENTHGAFFCTKCGKPLEQSAPAPETSEPQSLHSDYGLLINPAAQRLSSAFSDPFYMVLCILLSITATFGLSPIIILIAIFSWLCFANAKKGNIKAKHLRAISETVYADYIVTKILGWFVIALGVLSIVVFIALGSSGILTDILTEIIPYEYNNFFITIPATVLSVFGAAIGMGFIVGGIGLLITNKLGTKNIHSFAKSVYMSVESGRESYENVGITKGWLIAYSAINASSIIMMLVNEQFLSALTMGTLAAAGIIAFLLLKKYFSDVN